MQEDFISLFSKNISEFLEKSLFPIEAKVRKEAKKISKAVWELSDFAKILKTFNLAPVTFLPSDIEIVPEAHALLYMDKPSKVILPDSFYSLPGNWVRFQKGVSGYVVEYLPEKYRVIPREYISDFSGKEFFGFYLKQIR